jgi:Arm DNA-binding domain
MGTGPKNKLTAIGAERAKPGWHSDGDRLFLRVDGDGGRRWIVRYTSATGRKREMGLGDVGLAEARDIRDEAVKLLRAGKDPIDARRAERETAKAEAAPKAGRKTFRQAAESEIKRRESGWRGKGVGRNTSGRTWRMSLFADLPRVRTAKPLKWPPSHLKALQALNAKPVEDVDKFDVIAVLQHHWDMGELASAARLRDRIKAVLDHAIAHGWRKTANPIAKETFEKIEPARNEDEIAAAHHPALDWRAMPGFIADLRKVDAMSALALEMVALTACRSSEVRAMRWDEVDFDGAASRRRRTRRRTACRCPAARWRSSRG